MSASSHSPSPNGVPNKSNRQAGPAKRSGRPATKVGEAGPQIASLRRGEHAAILRSVGVTDELIVRSLKPRNRPPSCLSQRARQKRCTKMVNEWISGYERMVRGAYKVDERVRRGVVPAWQLSSEVREAAWAAGRVELRTPPDSALRRRASIERDRLFAAGDGLKSAQEAVGLKHAPKVGENAKARHRLALDQPETVRDWVCAEIDYLKQLAKTLVAEREAGVRVIPESYGAADIGDEINRRIVDLGAVVVEIDSRQGERLRSSLGALRATYFD